MLTNLCFSAVHKVFCEHEDEMLTNLCFSAVHKVFC